MTILLFLLLSQTPPQEAPPAKPSASLRGTVTDAETGKPLRMARVSATSPGSRQPRFTLTGADGVFELRDLPPAAYEISVSKARYVTTPWKRGDTTVATPVPVAAAAKIERIDVALPRAAAITGRIVDDLGDPIERATVEAMRPGFNERGRAFVSVGNAVTDDSGSYRIAGLQPGDYYVVAAERSDGFGSTPDADIGLLKTAYPGATSIKDARLVTVRAGQEAGGIDIGLAAAIRTRVSGRVTTSTGQTASGVWLVLQPVGDGPGIGLGGDARSGTDGSFLFPAVAPGRYEMHARFQREGAIVPLTVAGDDVTGWEIVITPGGKVRGRIVVPEGATLERSGVGVSLTPAGPTFTFGTGFGGPVKADWTFEADFLLGARVIRISGLPKGWFVEKITRGSEDLIDAVIAFKRDEVIDDVEIHLAQGAPALTGMAQTNDGKPVLQYSVVLFSEDESKWGPYSRYIASARADDKGAFTIEGPPPGRYHAAAVTELAPFQWTDREFLQSLKTSAVEVTLERGTRPAVTLKVTDR